VELSVTTGSRNTDAFEDAAASLVSHACKQGMQSLCLDRRQLRSADAEAGNAIAVTSAASLRALQLRGKQVELLAGQLRALTGLTKLCLSLRGAAAHDRGNAHVLDTLACSLRALTALQHLDLAYVLVARDQQSNKQLIQEVASMPTLQHLAASGSQLGTADVQAMAQVLRVLKSLTELALEHTKTISTGSCALAGPLAIMTQLRQLNVSDAGCNDEAVQGLAQSMPALTQLHGLRFAALTFGSDICIQPVMPAVARMPLLSALDLSHNNLSAASVQALAQALSTLTALQRLHLRCCEFGDGGARALAPPLATLAHLTHLDVSANDLTARGVAALGPCLAALTGLVGLAMSHMEPGPAGMQALAPALSGMAQLTFLSLAFCACGEQGAVALGAHRRSYTPARGGSSMQPAGRRGGRRAVASAAPSRTLDTPCAQRADLERVGARAPARAVR
jgi:Ran GTPase-activating protein (RanGAP) involved in mRNA processing and transport